MAADSPSHSKATDVPPWRETAAALQRLESLLRCSQCHQALKDPSSIESCNHSFCRECILRALNERDASCPECGVPAWVRDLRANRQLENLLQLSHLMREQISSPSLHRNAPCPIQRPGEEPSPSEALPTTDAAQQNSFPFKKPTVRSDLLRRRLKPFLHSSTSSHPHRPSSGSAGSVTETVKEEESRDARVKSTNSTHEFLQQRGNRKKDGSKIGISLPSPEKSFSRPVVRRRRSRPVRAPYGLVQPPYRPPSEADFPYSPLVAKTRHYARLDGAEKVKRLQRVMSVKVPTQQPLHIGARGRLPRSRQSHHQLKMDAFVALAESRSDVLSPPGPSQPPRLRQGKSPTPPPPTPSLTCARSMRRNARGETPLHVAAIKGDVTAVRALLGQGADLNAQDNARWTPLHEACNHGHGAVVSALLDLGALVNVPGFDNDTPLHDAVANGHAHIARMLLERGANPDLRNRHGQSPKDLLVSEQMRTVFSAAPRPPSLLVSPNAIQNPNSSPMIPGRLTKPVLLPTSLKGYQKAKVEELAGVLNADVVSSYSPEVTHVITVADKRGCSPRTLKVLCGVARGKWIVDIHWVFACLQAHSWVEEKSYEVRGFVVADAELACDAPRRGRENSAMKLPGLFDGCAFHFSPSSFPPSQSSTVDLCYLVKLAGGKVLAREPKPSIENVHGSSFPYHAKPNTRVSECSAFIVESKEVVEGAAVERWAVTGAGLVSQAWLLDCLSQFELVDLPCKGVDHVS